MKMPRLAVWGCLLLCSVAAGGSMELVKPRMPGKKYVETGETMIMRCNQATTKSIPVLGVWLRGQRLTVNSGGGRIKTSNSFLPPSRGGAGSVELHEVTINSVNISDAGTYECKEIGQSGIVGTLDIYVYSMMPLHALVGPNTKDAQVGCRARNSVENPSSSEDPVMRIVWFKKGLKTVTELNVEENDNIAIAGSGDALNITDIDHTNYTQVGAFLCEFQPDNGTRSINYTAYINTTAGARPFEPSSTFGIQGDPMEIRCKVYGYPIPQITWTMNGSSVEFNEKKSTSAGPQGIANSTLVFGQLEEEDYGNYTCHVSNDFGSGQATIALLQGSGGCTCERTSHEILATVAMVIVFVKIDGNI